MGCTMTDNLSSEFSDSVQAVGPAAREREAAVRAGIADIYRLSMSDTFRGWSDKSAVMDNKTMEDLYKQFSKGGHIDLVIGHDNKHSFDVRMKDHGGGNYSLALYEGSKHAGTGRTEGVSLTPAEIYAQNPLQAPQMVAAPKAF